MKAIVTGARAIFPGAVGLISGLLPGLPAS